MSNIGVVMKPGDHLHGGGEGRAPISIKKTHFIYEFCTKA